jgi:hypothetical protein
MRYEIEQDLNIPNPRDEDYKCGTMVCFHRRYTLGDSPPGFSPEDFSGWAEVEQHVNELSNGVYLPLYLYDHSGVTMKTSPFSCPWDSGQVGFIFANNRNETKEDLQKAVEDYDAFISGDYYGYVIYDDDNLVDSCWGFEGAAYCKQAAQAAIDTLRSTRVQS